MRALPQLWSPNHPSKWAAEQLISDSGLDYTILKAGMIYGRRPPQPHRADPASVRDRRLPARNPSGPSRSTTLTDILVAAIDGRMPRETVAVVGAEHAAAVQGRAARGIRRRPAVVVVPWPVWAQFALAQVTEWTMRVPLVAKAQVHMPTADSRS